MNHGNDNVLAMHNELEMIGSCLAALEQMLAAAMNMNTAIREDQRLIHTKLSELINEASTVDSKLYGIIHGSIDNLARLEHCLNVKISSVKTLCTRLHEENRASTSPELEEVMLQRLLNSMTADIETVQGDD